MLNWLTKSLSTVKGSSEGSQSNAVIRVIGDRGSGKTSYMASLARWPNADPSSPVQNVTPVNEEGEYLICKAQNILEQGLELEPTHLNGAIHVKDYTLSIAFEIFKVRKNFRFGPEKIHPSIP